MSPYIQRQHVRNKCDLILTGTHKARKDEWLALLVEIIDVCEHGDKMAEELQKLRALRDSIKGVVK